MTGFGASFEWSCIVFKMFLNFYEVNYSSVIESIWIFLIDVKVVNFYTKLKHLISNTLLYYKLLFLNSLSISSYELS